MRLCSTARYTPLCSESDWQDRPPLRWGLSFAWKPEEYGGMEGIPMDSNEAVNQSPQEPQASLPPDPDGKNEDRAEWAEQALATFMKRTGTDREDALCDLLADLMHWADRNGGDFDSQLDRARMHYEAETTGDDEPESGQCRLCDDPTEDSSGLCADCQERNTRRY